MPMNTDHFRMEELTDAINAVPAMPSLMRDLGVFSQSRGISTRVATFERKTWGFALIEEAEEGGPADYGGQPDRETFSFKTPLYKKAYPVHHIDVQDRRSFGSPSALMAVQELEQEAIENLRMDLDVSEEAQEVSALQGIVLKSDGTTLFNYFTALGATQKVVSLELDVTTTIVEVVLNEVHRHIEDNILDDSFDGVTAVVSRQIMDGILAHPEVRKTYQNFPDIRRLRDGRVREINYGGVLFVEYNKTVTESDGTSRKLIADNEGYAFPTGTRRTFRKVYAPADYRDAVNMPGLPRYAVEYMQNNSPSSPKIIEGAFRPLPYVMRPQCVVKLTLT